MTIRELFREFTATKQVMDDAHDRDAMLAWRIEALHRTKTLPAPVTLMRHRTGSQRQSVQQQRTVLEMLSAQYGGQLRPHRPSPRRSA